MINRTRTGAIYSPRNTDGRRLIINKILFLVAVSALYFYDGWLADGIAVVTLSVPLAEKCAVNIASKHYCSEYALILSAEVAFAAMGKLHNAVAMLIVYHIFDFIIFFSYNVALKNLFERSPLFEKTIDYRFNHDGDYILSNNEYVPLEGVVVAGEALVDFGRISGECDDFIPIHAGDKLLPACRIDDGSVIFRPLKSRENSVYERIKNVYAETLYNKNTGGLAKFFDFFKIFFTVACLVLAAVMLYIDVSAKTDLSLYVNAVAFFGCTGVMLTFSNAVEYVFMSRLAENGIYIVERRKSADVRVLEKDEVFGDVDFSEYDLYSVRLSGDEAQKVCNRYKKYRDFKLRFIIALIIFNAASAVASMIFSSSLLINLSLIITSALLAVVSSI